MHATSVADACSRLVGSPLRAHAPPPRVLAAPPHDIARLALAFAREHVARLAAWAREHRFSRVASEEPY